MAKHEEGDTRLRGGEAEAMSIVSKPLVPSLRGLLEAVERFVQTTHKLGSSRIDEAGRLLAVDLLVKIAMKKGILDVQLMNWLATRGGDDEDDADDCRPSDGAEGLIKINTWLQGKTSNNPAGLVPRESTSGVKLVLEDPFA
jgi:hypothetical protein